LYLSSSRAVVVSFVCPPSSLPSPRARHLALCRPRPASFASLLARWPAGLSPRALSSPFLDLQCAGPRGVNQWNGYLLLTPRAAPVEKTYTKGDSWRERHSYFTLFERGVNDGRERLRASVKAVTRCAVCVRLTARWTFTAHRHGIAEKIGKYGRSTGLLLFAPLRRGSEGCTNSRLSSRSSGEARLVGVADADA
jgi:hypothetical protein